jgi:hypothetical protein
VAAASRRAYAAANAVGGLEMVRLSAWFAILVGAGIAVAQIIRNYDNWENWSTWMIDEFAAAVLIVAGLLALRKQTTRLLVVGWAFVAGLYASGSIMHWNALRVTSGEMYVSEYRLAILLAILEVLALAGLALVLLAKPRS